VCSVLEALDELGSRPDGPHKKSATIVDHLYTTHGIPPRFGYEAMCAAAADWIVPIPLIDVHGNLGGADSTDLPASARYTEMRVARAGAMGLASERGELPRLPIGLINGDLAVGGTAPPFDPVRLVDALRAAATGSATDAELVERVGPPSFATGCSVAGDLAAIAAGTPTKIRVSTDIAIETDGRGTRLIISRVPFGVGPADVGEAIARRVDAVRSGRVSAMYPELQNELDLPLRDVRNESSRDTTRVVCELLAGANPELCRQRLLETWPVTIEITVRLGAPLATLVRGFVDEPTAQDSALRALLAAI
jgi:DNA gyrase/topoisomerase IV subunit A